MELSAGELFSTHGSRLRERHDSLGKMSEGGRIIHISSIHGGRAEMDASSYSVAKAAINQYCRAMALELADKNILVNAIAPGFVNTAMSVVDGQMNWIRNGSATTT
jgi:3-oxoacyl-[acyl-carrier protein] reductase